MNFKPVQKLTVVRTLSAGETTEAGTLVQNRTGVFFSITVIISGVSATVRL